MKTVLLTKMPWLERALAIFTPSSVLIGRKLSEVVTESDLQRHPPLKWDESQEANIGMMLRLMQSATWQKKLDWAAERYGVDRDQLQTLVGQSFPLRAGIPFDVVRQCISIYDLTAHDRLICDIPKSLYAEFYAQSEVAPQREAVMSFLLTGMTALREAGLNLIRQLLRIVSLVRSVFLPNMDVGGKYLAWIHGLPAEVANIGADKLSLLEMLHEGIDGSAISEVVLTGARPKVLLDGIDHSPLIAPMRRRPQFNDWKRAVLDQLKLLLDELRFIHDPLWRLMLSRALCDVPCYRLWFQTDPPEAVLYSNAKIKAEPPVALLRPRYSVPSMMVFYSANVSYKYNLEHYATADCRLEPEMRFITADKMTMWSDEMRQVFLTAGYEATRLPITGPIMFGRQMPFHPTNYSNDKQQKIRIGIFDVSNVKPSRKFDNGWGRLIYNPEFSERFFAEMLEAANNVFGDRAVILRKIKRAFNKGHAEDVLMAGGFSAAVEHMDHEMNLWRVLERVDMVICMPFTSVAYLAACYGLPAAYYSPLEDVEASLLGGPVPLLKDRQQLEAWMRSPKNSAAQDSSVVTSKRAVSSVVQ